MLHVVSFKCVSMYVICWLECAGRGKEGHGKEAESLDNLGAYSHLVLYTSSPGVRQLDVSVTHLREKEGNSALAVSV